MIEFIRKALGGKEKATKSSDFSRFFREASSREKKRVFLSVAKKASQEQLEVMKSVQTAR
jgi:hypothetical protein